MRVLAIGAVAASWLAGASPAGAAGTVTAEEIEAARARIVRGGYQTALPGQGSAAPLEPSARRPARRGREAPTIDTRSSRTERMDLGAIAHLLSYALWGCGIVGVVLVVAWLARSHRRTDADASVPAAAGTAHPAAILERPLGDADELARCGRIAEAIHTLFLHTLQELARSASIAIERAETSREILARVALRPDTRDALSELIGAVERTHFGDAPATPADYERYRAHFHRFAAAFLAGARAA